jgi:glycosyltransferase involved in cell wall biosynthesis
MNSFEDASISRIVLRLVENIASHGISWHVGALTGGGEMQSAFEGLDCRVAGFGANGTESPSRSIRSYVRAHGIDVVHTHTPRTIVATAFALRGLSGVHHVATKHTLYAPGDRRWGLAYWLIDRVSLYLPDVVVPVSRAMFNQISSHPLIDQQKIVLIRNAIAVDAFRQSYSRAEAREALGLPADAFVLAHAGRIERVKRIDVLLVALPELLMQLPQTRLVIAGEGSLKERLQMLAQDLGVAHAVTWAGFRRDMPRLLAAIDIYVQSSINEGLPLSILEAMAAGKAVVATRVGGSNEVIVDGETGILVPPESPSAISEAVLWLLAHPERRAELAWAARESVEAEFGLGRMLEGYGALYQSVVSAGSILAT